MVIFGHGLNRAIGIPLVFNFWRVVLNQTTASVGLLVVFLHLASQKHYFLKMRRGGVFDFRAPKNVAMFFACFWRFAT